MTSRRSKAHRRREGRPAPALRVVGPYGSPGQASTGSTSDDAVDLGSDLDLDAVISTIATEAITVVGRARAALSAELAIAGLLGIADQAAPAAATDQDRAAARADLMAELISWAATKGSPAALAFLRVAAVLGDAHTREAAATAAEGLAAAGVTDRRWATIVGRPRLLQAWWYADVFGNQESVNLLFDYAHREHSLSVLIDHQLGGGVKDCWIAEGRKATTMRTRMISELATNPVAEFADIDRARALDILQPALSHPTCPEQADQIQDVAAYQEILRARTRMLAAQPEQTNDHSS